MQGSARPRIRSRCAAIAAIVLALGPAVNGKQPAVANATLAFALPDLDGSLVRSTDPRFAGKVVLVDLWGTWCPPCLTEIPTFVELQSRYADRGLIIVAIAFEGEEDGDARRARLREFVAGQGINFLVLDGGRPDDFQTALPGVENVRGFPVEILVDRSGKVVSARNGYGFKKKWARRLKLEIEELL